MPLSWDQIQNSPVYQQMPPDQQTLAKQQYDSQASGAPSAAQQSQSSTQAPPAQTVAAPDWPDDMKSRLAQVPVQYQPLMKEIIEGRMPPDRAHFGNNFMQVQQLAAYVDPTLDIANPTARVKTAADFSSAGKSGQIVTALGTTSRHGAQLALNMLAENNRGGFPGATTWNNIANGYEQWTGDPAYSNANAVLNMYAPEAAKVARGVGNTSETEIAQMKKGIPLNGSPEQQLGALANTNDILLSKAKELQDTYNTNMGPVGMQKQIVNSHSLSALNDINALYEHAQNGTLDSPEAQLTKQKLAAYVKWYDDNVAKHGGANTQQSVSIPPMEQRKVGQVYQTPKGPMTWQGQGWLPAGGANAAP